jgi:hypothetical protein
MSLPRFPHSPPEQNPRQPLGAVRFVAGALFALLAGCATTTPVPQGVSVLALSQQPAERALLDGIRSYESGEFDLAGKQFRTALQRGLANASDQAAAHKYLAFIDCAFSRVSDCDAQFRAALLADPTFRLTPTEIGHPVWGPVYRHIMNPDEDN